MAGAAILLVLVDHALESTKYPALHRFTRLGSTGVGLFFALSGFLITSLLLSERASAGTIQLTRFYLRRAFRILPPVLVYLTVLVCLRHAQLLPVARLQIVSSLFLFRNYLPQDRGLGWYTAHFWSLMVEEHFYLFWPLVLRYTRTNIKVLASFALAVAAWRAFSFHYHILASVWSPGRTDVRTDALLWGCIASIVFANPAWREILRQRLSGKLVLALLVLDALPNLRSGPHYYSFYEPIVLTALLVWPILHAGSLLRAVLDTRLLTRLGAISYSLYIWQQFWLLFPGAPTPFPRLQSLPVSLVLALTCAAASYYLVKTPCIALGRRLTAQIAASRKQLLPALPIRQYDSTASMLDNGAALQSSSSFPAE